MRLHLCSMNNELGRISRQQMLLEMETSEGKPFLIKFISSADGRLCCIEQAVSVAQKRQGSARSVNVSGEVRKVSNLRDTGKIPITNLDAAEGFAFRTPFVSHIIQFNQYRVRH